MRILVTGGTGTVGGQVVRTLLARNQTVRVLTRSPHKLGALGDKVEKAEGSLADKSNLPAAMAGVDRLFLLTPLSPDETEQGLNGVEAAKAGSVQRIVFMTVHGVVEGRHIPHFGSKIPVKEAIQNSGLQFVFIEPNNFYQNDLWLEDPIRLFGVYPQPLGAKGLHRVDTRDIADAVVNALLNEGHSGRSYPLVGPKAWTGEQCAGVWSKHLNRDVQYVGDDLDNWAKQAELMMPPWMVHDLRIMFEHFQKVGLLATGDDIKQSETIVGHPLRHFDDFVAEVVRSWS